MESTKHLSFLATKSMGSLRAEFTDAVISQKNQRHAHRVLPGPDGRATIQGTARDSIHSRWSSNASTVRETPTEDRVFRRASGCHPIKADDAVLTQKSRRWTRANLEGDPNSPPELPLLRISSFPDMMAAGLSVCSPDSTPASNSDSFTVSDSSSSFQGMLGFASEFPQPPSLSPALRRMQSAPWLKDQNAGSDMAPADNYSWRRMSHATERLQDVDLYVPCSLAELQSFSRDNFDSADILFQLERARREKKAVTLEQVEKGSPLDRLRQETAKTVATGDLSWSRKHGYRTRTTDDLPEWSSSHKSRDASSQGLGAGRNRTESSGSLAQPRLEIRAGGRRNTMSSTAADTSLAEKPRTIRKVASMQSQAQGKPFLENTGQRTIPKIRSLRLFPPHSYSKHDQSEGANKPRNWLFLRASSGKMASSTSEGRISSVDGMCSGGGKPSLVNRTPYPSGHHYDKDQPRSRTNKIHGNRLRDSVPRISGLGFDNYEIVVASKSSVGLGLESTSGGGGGTSTRQLDKAFILQKTKDLNSGGEPSEREACNNNNTSVDTSTSFMDITPDRVTKVEKPAATNERKDRVRKFIAKASSGFLIWGRGLTAKKVHTP